MPLPIDKSFEADVIVVGAGSAGCVLAARLSEMPSRRVLLIEAGPPARNPWISVPFGMQMLITNPRLNWLYETEPVAGLNGRRLFQPRGKVIGGTGSINASLYVRGNAADFDGWRDRGCQGWSYADMLPYFKRAEHRARGPSEYHGTDGPMHVSDAPGDVLSGVFLRACAELQLPQTSDFNGASQDGFGRFQTTTRQNKRHSSAAAYLTPALRRPNLKVLTDAHTTRVVIENGKAVGVNVLRGSTEFFVRANREVVVAAGTFKSPQLLELSGIGEGSRLRALGIPVQHHLPGVGANLQEHFGVKFISRVSESRHSLNRVSRNPARKALALARYVFGASGPLAWTNTFVGGFARSDPSLAAPDLQITMNGWSATGTGRTGLRAHAFPGITFNLYHLTPDARGSVHLTSADPLSPPTIHMEALGTAYDRAAVRSAIRMARRLIGTPAFQEFGLREAEPGADASSDSQLDDFARRSLVAMYHPVGTCRMGVDAAAVVGPSLGVHGIGGLRVADASVMPSIPRGNTNAATVAIAEKACDLINASV